MEIELEVTVEDYIDFNMYYLDQSATIKKQLLLQKHLPPVFFMIVPFVGEKLLGMSLSIALPIFFIAALIWEFFYPRYFKNYTKRQLMKVLNEGKNKAVIGKKKMILTPKELIEINLTGESRIRWGSIEKIAVTQTHIFLFLGTLMAYIIPKRAFLNELEVESFLDLVNKYSENDKPDE